MDHQTLRVSQSQEDINSADQKDYLQQFYYTMPGQPLPNPAHLGLDTIKDFFVRVGHETILLYFLKMCPIFVGSLDNFGMSDVDMK